LPQPEAKNAMIAAIMRPPYVLPIHG